ncbi:hypothetical protein M436DRAFT_80225 [Aureobasidium namibiae CBS 147.97]|uniref:Uncharacterized protein n=1 Tax=Aureobasidium namibiae CBS 147.97 TaxID=1043004 RepID=A0A074WNR1_9PEZI|nr:uncharacterized protein M436DRAFT_80225 [Aureobasidium namibiae CBS 147.97]KEQ74760.1 hypothetical protein M436DRAFT_80225 [Aureobasidium namibiae CBS 147.97]
MPEEYQYLRTRLQYENFRFADWCEAAGFDGAEDEKQKDLPESVKAIRLVLVAILTEMQLVMDELSQMAERFETSSKTDFRNVDAETSDFQMLEMLKQLRARDHKATKDPGNNSAPATKSRSKGRWLSMATNLKNIAKNPRRFVWVAFSREEFEKLLGRFKELNENLYQLLHGEQSRFLMDLTRKTQLDMVLVLRSVEELKHLQLAAVLRPEPVSDASPYSRSDQVLASLANFKQLNTASEYSLGSQQEGFDDNREAIRLDRSRITFLEDDEESDNSMGSDGRAAGILDKSKPGQRHIWLEWRGYLPERSSKGDDLIASSASVRRVQDLVVLLKLNKLAEFCAPICHGYFDDNDHAAQDDRNFRFGLVFESPDALKSAGVPETLRTMLSRSTPSLSARVQLAQRLCTCLLYLHAVNWLHKGINRHNVIFADPHNLLEPCVAGFELARPDTDQDKTQPGRHQVVGPRDDLYCHPLYRGAEFKPTYQKTFDIYSLGLVLLEIAFWKPIESIMRLEDHLSNRNWAEFIRNELIQADSKHMKELRARMGDKYQSAVSVCIIGRMSLGVEEHSDETDVPVAAKLQRAFMERVVDVMGAVRV